MSEQNPANRPGHLDIDAVSAFVDRDFHPDDLATIEIHLHECPECHREVVEIRTTIVLLAGLPQYAPRRSFCLGHEHARAARRRGRIANETAWPPFAPLRSPASAPPAQTGDNRGGGWLPGFQAAAIVIGALLLLVTSSDLMGMPPQPAEWLSESEAPAQRMSSISAPPPRAAQPFPTAAVVIDADSAPAPASSESESSLEIAADQSGGTTSGDSASEEVPVGENLAPSAPGIATSAALTAVAQVVPTAAAAPAQEPEAATGTAAPATSGEQPSRLRLVQIVLAFALAWLVVSIVGLRWVRGLRRAPG